MTDVKLAVWNMEWLNKLFVTNENDPAFKPDSAKPDSQKKDTVGQRIDKLSRGLAFVDPDILVIVEGPDRPAELQLLIDRIGQGSWVTFLQKSPAPPPPAQGVSLGSASQQCLGIAVRTDRSLFANPPFEAFDAIDPAQPVTKATDPFYHDTGRDKVLELYAFERRPIYAEIRLADGGKFRVLGVHLKSKGIFDAIEWSRWWQMADANRERLLAQCRHLREAFLDPYLTTPETKDIPLIVCGDINDGPGFDTSEMRLLASGVETLMGSVWKPELSLGNALFDGLKPKDQAELDFRDLYTTSFADPIFNQTYHREWIDHILYSRAQGRWIKDAAVIRSMPDGIDPATNEPKTFPFYEISDHFPIVATVTIS